MYFRNKIISFVARLSFRYRVSTVSSLNKSSRTNLLKLLNICEDIEVAYELATHLGLNDFTTEMLYNDNKAFLRDIVQSK